LQSSTFIDGSCSAQDLSCDLQKFLVGKTLM